MKNDANRRTKRRIDTPAMAATRAPPWKPGQSGNPAGRQIGSRNKLTEAFLKALHDDFVQFGPAAIAEVREQHASSYLRIIATVIPRELQIREPSAFEGLSDDELNELIGTVRRTLAARTPSDSGEGSETPPRLN